MSRAFVKEDDEDRLNEEELGVPPLDGPVLLTPAGFERLQSELEQARTEVVRLRGGSSPEDRLALARATRRLRVLEQRRGAARVVDPARASRDADTVGFGARVQVEDAEGRGHAYTIVGAAEADPAHGLVNLRSPLARALMGHHTGDTVTWRRPAGEMELTITGIEYPET